MLYKDLVKIWLPLYSMRLLNTTAAKRAGIVSAYLLPAFGDTECSKITSEMIQNKICDWGTCGSLRRKGEGLAPASIADIVKPLRISLDFAISRGLISDSPLKGVVMPRIMDAEISVLNDTDIERLLKSAKPQWFADAVEIAYRTGLRRGEIAGLMWRDIDFDKRFVYINRSVSPKISRGDEPNIHPPKTKTSKRRVDLDKRCIEILERRMLESKSLYVFPSSADDKLPLEPSGITHNMAKCCKAAGVNRFRFHDLRHTHATLLLSRGINPKVVQERLGHSDVSITLKVYGHVVPSMQREVINLMDTV